MADDAQDVTELHIWLSRDPHNGDEEATVVVPTPFGLMPLMSHDLDKARRYGQMAALAAKQRGHAAVLVTFTRGASRAIACPRCKAVSHHPNDAEYLYCGRCELYIDGERVGQPRTGLGPPPA